MENKKRLFNPMNKFDESIVEMEADDRHQSTFAMPYCANIQVERDTENPTKVWERYQIKRQVKTVKPKNLETPIFEDRVRVVCLSDTHSRIEDIPEVVPDGDILIHAGDFTKTGLPHNIEKFNNFLGKLPHEHKIVIAGNHELTFDDSCNSTSSIYNSFKAKQEFLQSSGMTSVKELLTNCIYLEDSMVELYGIKIYGSPWQPAFCDWAFNVKRGEDSLKIWNQIPDETDILITHGPPLGYGDKTNNGLRAGCVELLNTIQKRVRPKYHIYGHVHEDYGIRSDGYTTYINASICTRRYKPDNQPIIFDIPLPPGCSKNGSLETLSNSVKQPDQLQGGASAV